MEIEERFFPKNILALATKSGKEFGWKKVDFENVVNIAVTAGLAIVGGQVQYIFEDGTCEAYWLDYDSTNVKFTGNGTINFPF